MLTIMPAKYAALINVGDNPLIGLLVTVIVVGICVYAAIWLLDNFVSKIMSEPFARAARGLIFFIGILIVVVEALRVVFGITLG